MGMGRPHIQKTIEEIYCIDTSSLINLIRHNGLPYEPYPRDIFPDLWEKLESMVGNGRLISHMRVYREISRRDDLLFEWCKINKGMFYDVDECQLIEIKTVRDCYEAGHWKSKMDKASEWADPWVVTLSLCRGGAVIVSDEKPKNDNSIPKIAEKLGIECINLMEFLRRIGLGKER